MDGCAAITRQGTSSDNEPCAVPAELDVGVTEEAEVELQMVSQDGRPDEVHHVISGTLLHSLFLPSSHAHSFWWCSECPM